LDDIRCCESGDGSLGLFDQATGQARWLVDHDGRMGINTTQPTSTLTVDGYIETTKGFLVNGRPLGGIGLSVGSQPLFWEGGNNSLFGTGAGASNPAGTYNSFFLATRPGTKPQGGTATPSSAPRPERKIRPGAGIRISATGPASRTVSKVKTPFLAAIVAGLPGLEALFPEATPVT